MIGTEPNRKARPFRESDRNRIYAAVGLLSLSTLLAGCGLSSGPTDTKIVNPPVATSGTPQGKVYGGQQPVASSTVQLWQVGTTGYGAGATPLGNAVVTDGNGNFALTGQYSCSSAINGANSRVYITATGGNPGLSPGTNNTALALMAALGPCSSLTSSTFITINEVTTVASVYALSQFMGPNGTVGAYGSSPAGLVNAFNTVNNLASIGYGTSLSAPATGTGVAPAAKVNTLANILASCVNSSSPTSSSCTSLFNTVAPLSGSAPTTTIGAMLSIALNPTYNVTPLLQQTVATAPFQPNLSSGSVNDWSLAIGFASGGIAPSALAVDGSGNVWIANSGGGTAAQSSVSFLSPVGNPATNSPFNDNGAVNGASALAIDQNNNVWLANKGNNSAIVIQASTNNSSSTMGPAAGPFTSGLSSPQGLAIDASSNVWVVNAGNSSMTEYQASNYNGSPNTYTTLGLSTPQGIAFDNFGTAWVSDLGNGTVTAVNTTSATVTGTNYTATGLTAPSGIVVDASSNIWVTDATVAKAAELNHGGVAISPTAGLSGGGLAPAASAAIDGAGSFWVPNAAANSVSVFTNSGTAVTGTTGLQDASLGSPVAIALDSSGNAWVADQTPQTVNGQKITVTEFVGAAAPVITPLSAALKAQQLGQRPGTPKPPTALAGGPYAGTVGSPISFNGGNSTDPNNLSLTYTWAFGDSSAGSGSAPQHIYNATGTYPVTLTVTNSNGVTRSIGTAALIGAQPATIPVASAGGPYTSDTATPVTFDGSGSYDPTKAINGALGVSLSWSFGDGTSGAGINPVHTYGTTGTYTVTVTATSSSGGTATASTTATITQGASTAANPVVNANGPYTGTVGTALTFSSAGTSDPNNLTLMYVWNFGDGNSAAVANPTHTYGAAGTYSVTLFVSDGVNNTTVGTTAKISSGNTQNLVASAGGPYSVGQGQVLHLNGSATNPNNGLLVYTWDFGDGSTGSGAQPYHIWTTQGTYTANLSVSDGIGPVGNSTAKVTVGPPPAEAITANAGGPYNGTTGQTIQFDASGSVDNLSYPMTYSWNFGDGTTGTGLNPTHSYSASGGYTATLTASSSTASGTATATVTITPLLGVTITSPTPNFLTGATSTTVSGTVTQSGATVTVNGVTAQMSGNNFTATGVSLREGVNIISANATGNGGAVGSASVAVIVTLTPPGISITSPATNAAVSQSNLTVAGLVTDVVTGTIGTNPITVTVNGQTAQVSNHSFALSNVLLAPGANTITAVSTDSVGNTSQASVTVNYVPPTATLSLNVLSGDAQTGAVKSILPQPLVVQLLSASGTPVAGRPVTFTVSRSDGLVEVMPNSAQTLMVTTDANGKASVLFQLGTRQGLAVNQVTASTPGAAGTVTFTASTTPGAASHVYAVRGEYQRGLIGTALAEAFQVLVTDAYANPIPGASVNFTSTGASDGSLSTASATSDVNGKAYSTLTLGQQEGTNNYVVSATITGNAGSPVVFTASAYAPGPVGETTVSGIVLDNTNTPVPNATVTIQGTTLRTVTNTSGTFTIANAPVGTVVLTVDGSTSTSTQSFPFLTFVLQSLPGVNNTVGKPIFLPALDINDAQTVGGSSPVTLGIKGIPGAALTVAPNSVTFPDGSNVGQLTVSQVKSDMVPMQPKDGSQPGLLWTVQPAGTKFNPPVQITVPNTDALPPGAVSEFYQFDHDLEQFVSAGTGHVSADGSVITSDPGFGITKAGWIHAPTYPLPTACVTSCDDHNICTDDSVDPNNCQACIHKGVDGRICGNAVDPNSCKARGTCVGPYCSAGWLNDGTPCTTGLYCLLNQRCEGGQCIGDQPQQNTTNAVPGPIFAFEKSYASGFEPLFNKLSTYLGGTLSIKPSWSVNAQVTTKCCEAQRSMNSQTATATVQVGIALSTPDIDFPSPYKIPFIGGVNLYWKAGVAMQAGLTYQGDDCPSPPQSCFKGSFGPQITFEIGLKAGSAVTGSLKVGGTGGATANVTLGCGEDNFTLGSTGFSVVVYYQDSLGNDTKIVEFPIVAPFTLGTYTYKLP